MAVVVFSGVVLLGQISFHLEDEFRTDWRLFWHFSRMVVVLFWDFVLNSGGVSSECCSGGTCV